MLSQVVSKSKNRFTDRWPLLPLHSCWWLEKTVMLNVLEFHFCSTWYGRSCVFYVALAYCNPGSDQTWREFDSFSQPMFDDCRQSPKACWPNATPSCGAYDGFHPSLLVWSQSMMSFFSFNFLFGEFIFHLSGKCDLCSTPLINMAIASTLVSVSVHIESTGSVETLYSTYWPSAESVSHSTLTIYACKFSLLWPHKRFDCCSQVLI